LVLAFGLALLGWHGVPALAQADWPPGGVPLCGSDCYGDLLEMCPDGAGGVFVAWRRFVLDPVDGVAGDLYLQRVTGEGQIAPGWPAGGLPVCTAPRDQAPHGLVPDGLGGALMVWSDFRNAAISHLDLYAQRITAAGEVAPGWIPDGVPVCRAPGIQLEASILADGAGGAFFAWQDERYVTHYDVFLQHLLGDGGVAAGWPADGRPIIADTTIAKCCVFVAPDAAGGLFAVWNDGRTGGIFALRLTNDGSVAPGWPADGHPVLSARGLIVALAADGAGGGLLITSWFHPDPPMDDYDLVAQRFGPDGQPALGWSIEGVLLSGAPDWQVDPALAADGAGGLLAAWYDARGLDSDIYAARLLGDGSVAPGWVPGGTQVSAREVFESDAQVAADGAGGMYVAYQRDDGYVALQHLTADGQVAPGWPAEGINPDARGGDEPVLLADGMGGVFLAWVAGRPYVQRFREGPTAVAAALVSASAEPGVVRLRWHTSGLLRATVQRQRAGDVWRALAPVTPDGEGFIALGDRDVVAGARYGYRLAVAEAGGTERFLAEAWVEVPQALALALEGLRPNPATEVLRVAFTLPSAAPATLELLDLTGRRLVQREVGGLGAGRHLVRLDEVARPAPGMYWLRLTLGERTLTTRGAVVR
jgi:hypothetical protein